MSAGLGQCGCCDDPLQPRFSLAFHHWWGDQVRGAPNSSAHYLRRMFTYAYHVDLFHNGIAIYSWDWVEYGQIDQNKWTGVETVFPFVLLSGLRCPSYVLSTTRYGDSTETSFTPSFDYPPENFNASTGSVANNWYTVQAWWAQGISLNVFYFSGIPRTPQPGDYIQLANSTIADSQFAALGLTTSNIGEYSWGIRLKTEVKYDITQYYSKTAFIDDYAAIKQRANFQDIKTKTAIQSALGAYIYYYSVYFYDPSGAIVERNYYETPAKAAMSYAENRIAVGLYTEKVGSNPVSALRVNLNPQTGFDSVGVFYSAIDSFMDVGGPRMFTVSPARDGGDGAMQIMPWFAGVYLVSIYPIASGIASYCLTRYAAIPNAATNNANSDRYGNIRNGALWADGITPVVSAVTFPNPGVANIECQCVAGWTSETLVPNSCT